jgi:DNA recombination protein RmuC
LDKYVLVNIVLSSIVIILLLVLVIRSGSDKKSLQIEQELQGARKDAERLENIFREEIRINREENSSIAQKGREEQAFSLQKMNESLLNRIHQNAALQNEQLDAFSKQLANLTHTNEQRLETVRQTINEQLDAFSRQLSSLTQSNEQKIETVRLTLEERLKFLQEDNSNKLELMRATVDEKLHATLEKRLGESFQLVSERLELVHKGLGEMQVLAAGVGDLKKVMTNVKTRGVWGEIQLGNILETILTPEQYALNVATKQGSNDRVEFAIRLPGRGESGQEVWLPIDANFLLRTTSVLLMPVKKEITWLRLKQQTNGNEDQSQAKYIQENIWIRRIQLILPFSFYPRKVFTPKPCAGQAYWKNCNRSIG